MDAILGFELAGSKVWRILALFGIILIAFLIGRIVKYFLKKSGDEFEIKERFIAATTLYALAKSVVFLFVSFGITISLAVLKLQRQIVVGSSQQ